MHNRGEELVIFGVSNMLSDIFDCAIEGGIPIGKVVMNQPEIVRERTKNVYDRLAALGRPVQLLQLEQFLPGSREGYFIGTTAPGRIDLVRRLQDAFSLKFKTLIHPRAYVSSLAKIGEGVFVGANSVVAPGAEVGDFVFINRGVTVGHDTKIEAYARLQPGCNVGGHVSIGRATTIGLGAAVIEELKIGERCLVAAGAVVLQDVEDAVLVAGVPAKFKKNLMKD